MVWGVVPDRSMAWHASSKVEVMDWLYQDFDNAWKGILSSALILGLVIIIVRVAGLRTFSKMTCFDFAVTIALGSILGTVATTSATVLQGVVGLAALVFAQAVAAMLTRKSKVARQWIENQPLLLMRDGDVLRENLQHARMSESELVAKLREANVLRKCQVRAVVLETTGDVSVLHSDSDDGTLEDWLLDGVREDP